MLIRDLVSADHAADEAAAGGEARGHLDEDSGEQGSSGDAAAEAGVDVAEDADDQRAKGVGDLRVVFEPAGREVVGDEADEGQDHHDGHLRPAALVDDDQADGEDGHEDPLHIGVHRVHARHSRRGTGINTAVDCGANGDAVAKEKAEDDRVDNVNGAGDNVLGLKFQSAAYCSDQVC